jgi:hypothetical protein
VILHTYIFKGEMKAGPLSPPFIRQLAPLVNSTGVLTLRRLFQIQSALANHEVF